MTRKGDPRRGGGLIRPLMILLIAVAGAAGVPARAAAQAVHFEFNPPTPLTYVETVRTTRATTHPDGQRHEVVGETSQRVHLDRQGEGYSMTVTPISIKQIVGGRAVDPPPNPLLDVITRAVLTYELDADGALESMSGLEPVIEEVDTLIEALQAQASPVQREQMAGMVRMVESMLSPEALLARARSEWEGRVSGFDGVVIDVGETLAGQEDFPLPAGGAVRYHTVLRLEELVPCGEHTCARFVFKYDTDSAGLRRMLGDAFEPLPDVSFDGVSVTGGGERVIDPATLLIHREVNERTIAVDGSVGDQAAQAGTRYEKREYAYDYGAENASP